MGPHNDQPAFLKAQGCHGGLSDRDELEGYRQHVEDALNLATARACEAIRVREVGPESMERLHIVGLGPRTGTTLLAECMATCFEIDAFEPHEASLCASTKEACRFISLRILLTSTSSGLGYE